MSGGTQDPGGPAGGGGFLDDLLGVVDYEHLGEGVARARMPVTKRICQPFGIVHGGAYAALAETVASRATYEDVGPEMVALGQSNDTSFLRGVSEGMIEAEGRARHRGRTSWIWEVDMSDGEGRLCALSRLTIAVRPLKRS